MPEIIEVYQEGLNYIDRVLQTSGECLRALKDAKSFSQGMLQIVPLLEGIDWLYNALMQIKDIQEISFSEFSIEGETIQEILDKYKDFAVYLSEAIKIQSLSDLSNIFSNRIEAELTEMRKVYETLLIYYQNKCYVN